MSATNAKRTIVFLIALAVAAGIVRSILKAPEGTPLADLFKPRRLLGALIVGVVLLAISDQAPRFAAGFAVLIAVAALVSIGRDPTVIQALGSFQPSSSVGKPPLQSEVYNP